MAMKRINYLKVLMAKKGVGYREVATGADVSTSTLSKIANNQTVQIDMYERVCEYFGVDLPELFTIEHHPG